VQLIDKGKVTTKGTYSKKNVRLAFSHAAAVWFAIFFKFAKKIVI